MDATLAQGCAGLQERGPSVVVHDRTGPDLAADDSRGIVFPLPLDDTTMVMHRRMNAALTANERKTSRT